MATYKLSNKSDSDLSDIYQYGISHFGYFQAKDYFNEMHEILQLLANNSGLGREASEFLIKLKRFSFRAHTIFYLETNYGILIVRVLGQKVDYGSKL